MPIQTTASRGYVRPISIAKPGTIRRLLLGIASVIFTLSLIEFPALVQVLDYRTMIGAEHAWWAPNITDRELLHVHRPHAHQKGSALGGDAAAAYQIPRSDMTPYQWDVKYDHNGFRNELDLKQADIIVIGDSIVEGLTVSNSQLMTSLLSNLQGKLVANLGQSAYGPQQELVVLKRFGLPLQPRTVVWMFFEGNDLSDVIGYWDALRHPPSFWRSFFARSFTRNVLKEVRGLSAPPAKLTGVKHSAVLHTSTGDKLTVYFGYSSNSLSKDDLSALDETVRTLTIAHLLCAAQGARLMVVFVPDKFRVFRRFCQFPEASECRNWGINDLPERLQKAVGSISSEVGFLDLTPNLVNGVKTEGLPYYPDDEHWSPQGHKIAAEAINSYLLSTPKRRLQD
jgi:hypothetical protein